MTYPGFQGAKNARTAKCDADRRDNPLSSGPATIPIFHLTQLCVNILTLFLGHGALHEDGAHDPDLTAHRSERKVLTNKFRGLHTLPTTVPLFVDLAQRAADCREAEAAHGVHPNRAPNRSGA